MVLLQKVKEALKPKETTTTIGVGITYGIVIGALLLLPFPPKSIQAQSTPQPLPRPKTPKILEVYVDYLGYLDVPIPGWFDITVVADGAPAWTHYEWYWSGVYNSGLPTCPDYVDALAEDGKYRHSYLTYWNFWNGEYWWEDTGSTYNCTVVSQGDGRHVADVGLDVRADAHFYLLRFQDGTFWPIGWITDSDGGSYYVPVIWNGNWYPGL